MSCVLQYAYINAKYKQVRFAGGAASYPPLLGCRPACRPTTMVANTTGVVTMATVDLWLTDVRLRVACSI